MDFGDVLVKTMNINFSIESDENGNITHIDNDTNHPPTRRVLVEKHLLKKFDMELMGQIVMVTKSIYEEPVSFGDYH